MPPVDTKLAPLAPLTTARTRINLPINLVRRNLVAFLRSEGAKLDGQVQFFVWAKKISANVYENRERTYGAITRTEATLSFISKTVTQVDAAVYPENPVAVVQAHLRVTQPQADMDTWAARFEAYVGKLDQRSVG
jgi:hypothetical protein